MPAIFTRSVLDSTVRAERASRTPPAFSLSRLISSMAVDGIPMDGYERELMQETAASNGDMFSRNIAHLPLSLLADPTTSGSAMRRDLQSASGAAGGYLVGTETAPVLDILRPWSVAARSGITVLQADGRGTGISVPHVTAGATGYWLSDETATITPSAPTLNLITLKRRSAGALIKFSMLLNKQSGVLDALLQRELLRTVGALIDKAIFNGSGANGEPRGILNTEGINAATGTNLTAVGLLAIEARAFADANAGDAKIGFVTTPAVRQMLRGREQLSAGPVMLWQSTPTGDQLIGCPANVTTDIPAATMLAGPWNNAILGIWGTPRIEINPYDQTGFKTMVIEARLIVDIDVAVQTPAAWTAVTSIT